MRTRQIRQSTAPLDRVEGDSTIVAVLKARQQAGTKRQDLTATDPVAHGRARSTRVVPDHGLILSSIPHCSLAPMLSTFGDLNHAPTSWPRGH
jgi:hypothetical protein